MTGLSAPARGPLRLAFLVLILLTAPLVQAVATQTLLGEDAADDAENRLAPGLNGAALGPTAATDILAVHMGLDETYLYVNMTIAALPSGSGGYMYHVQYVRDGNTENVCYNAQYAAGSRIREDTVGCTRFTGTTRPPTTASAGVVTGTTTWNGTDAAYILWPVELRLLISPITTITNITADTWFRGASTCCPGSSQSADHVWNQADQAPDEGPQWTFSANATAAANATLDLALVVDQPARTVEAGSEVRYRLQVGVNETPPANETVVVDLEVEGMDNWDWSLEARTLELNATRANATTGLNVSVPSDRSAETRGFNVTACARNTTSCANLTLELTVVRPDEPTGNATPTAPPRIVDGRGAGNDTANATAEGQGNATVSAKESPGVGLPLLVFGGAAAAAWQARRRRPLSTAPLK